MANVELPQIGINNTQIDEAGMDGLKQHVKSLLNVTVMLTEELSYLLNNLDTRNVNELNADIINAGTINAGLVKILSELENGGYIQIDGTGMHVNDGTRDTMTIGLDGKPKMTGAYIESAKGYPKVVMDPDTELLGAYQSPSSVISMYTPLDSVSPVIRLSHSGKNSYVFHDTGESYVTISSNDVGINLSTQSFIELFGDPVKFFSWNALRNNSTGRSLQQDLNNKANSGASTGSSGGHNHGIPDGTQLMTAGGGTITWQSAPQHSHPQS
ncbi:hypothetical protein [Paenibacillus sp. Marseille-Q4541]|uniref:hypothetical protein n=1 Tax=Paenibacillus sp. Marseille-Q4541 TaxID=2831522 RepID=UPI001BA9F735|nr:hypothetical protein [Paenibacillus sp. Marseille-Q4541]